MTTREHQEYIKGYDELAELLERPERQASTEEVRQVAVLQREARGDAPLLSDKAQVAKAVASALIDSRVKNPAQREALIAAVNARMAECEQANKVPAVPVYDKAAPSKSQQPEHDRTPSERSEDKQR